MYIQLHTKEEQEKIVRALKGPQFDRNRHGSLHDRGSADSYYGRRQDPHWWPEGTSHGVRVTELTAEERAEYLAGYEWNERYGDKKDWR
jgi:hypothetical protein